MSATIPSGQAADAPTPGKQVAQSVELPASTSTWTMGRGGGGLAEIGEPRPLDETRTEAVHYWLFLPFNYEEQTQSGGAPLLLFLHGAGERGDPSGEDIARVKIHGPPRLLDNPEFAKSFPAVTVSPQVKNGYAWSPAQLMLLLDHIEENFVIDKSRVYVTGLSMGGFGTWMCLNESPERFAAAAPVCGGAKPEWAERLLNIPIWVFHGDQDVVVRLDLSQNIVDAIRQAGGRNVVFTIYEGVGHDSWTPTYNNQLLYDWMFQQSSERGGSAIAPQTSRVRVTLTQNGNPLSGATITLYPIRADGTTAFGTTDAEGRVYLQPSDGSADDSIPPGEYTVSFSQQVEIPDEENGSAVTVKATVQAQYVNSYVAPIESITVEDGELNTFDFHLDK